MFAPATGAVIAHVPLSSPTDVAAAVRAARPAFPAWSATPVKERVESFFRYRSLVKKNLDKLSALIVEVVASIVPFNFPSMVPRWSTPTAIALGNTMLLKPSEHVPLSALRIADLLTPARLPAGVCNVVHGARETAQAICDHPYIAAVTFVGSTRIAQQMYRRAIGNLKRALTLGGAKNHLTVLPDAGVEMTASNVAASMSGCSAQRCMAASVMLAVGSSDAINNIVQGVVNQAKSLAIGREIGPVVSAAAKTRLEAFISDAEAAGARVLVDGRNATVAGHAGGFYVGATVIDGVTSSMRIAHEEVFKPVLAIVRMNLLDEALVVEHSSPYGNAASVFTEKGSSARYVAEHATSGMIGVNVGVPVLREPFGFGGWGDSCYGTGEITGLGSIGIWTRLRKTTTKWNRDVGTHWMS